MKNTIGSTLPKWIKIVVAAICLTSVIVYMETREFSRFKEDGDTVNYIAMATGHPEIAPLHHARRILHPWVVGKLGFIFGTDMSFFLVGTASLLLFILIVMTVLVYEFKSSLFAAAFWIFLPCLFRLYRDLYLPQLFYVFLCSIYMWMLIRKKYIWSILFLFLLFLTRDEAIVTSCAFISALLIAFLKDRKNKAYLFYLISTIIVVLLSLVFINRLTRNNTNIHHMPILFYQIFRMPLYAMQNFTGFKFWFDTYLGSPDYTHPPVLLLDAPRLIQSFSIIKKIGIYEWDLMLPLETLLLLLSVFGLAPLVLFNFIKNRRFKIQGPSLAFNTMLFSGSLQYFIGPLLSYPGWRYYVNAWPAFFLVTPLFLNGIRSLSNNIFKRIIACHVISAWLPFFYIPQSKSSFLVLIVAEIIIFSYAWHILSAISGRVNNKKC